MLGPAGFLLPGSFLASGVARAATASRVDVKPLTPTVSLFSGGGCNVLAKKAGNGELMVIDGALEQNAPSLLDAIGTQMKSDNITTLVNTHWHREQTGLNRSLGERGVRIFSHENTRLWLGGEIERPWEDFAFKPLPKNARPTETFYHYGELTHGDGVMQYGYLRQAHTDGDMYAYFPEDNVLHAGGVVSNDGWPLIDWWTGGWIGGLPDALEVLLGMANDDTVIVPANGPVMSKAELSEMHTMYSTIFDRIRKLFQAAKSPQETLDAKPTAEFDAKWGNSDMFVLLAHQSVLAHYAPDA